MTWPDLARVLDRHEPATDASEITNIAVLALLLVLLLTAGFSVVTQWTVEDLRAPRMVTVDE